MIWNSNLENYQRRKNVFRVKIKMNYCAMPDNLNNEKTKKNSVLSMTNTKT